MTPPIDFDNKYIFIQSACQIYRTSHSHSIFLYARNPLNVLKLKTKQKTIIIIIIIVIIIIKHRRLMLAKITVHPRHVGRIWAN